MDHQHDEHGWDYDDGRARMSSRSRHMAWSSSSNPGALASSSRAIQDSHHAVHNAALAHHHTAMEHMNMMQQTMQASMNVFQPHPPAMLHGQSRISRSMSGGERSLMRSRRCESSSSDGDSTDEKLEAFNKKQDARHSNLTRQYAADRSLIQQQGAALDRRLQLLEAQDARHQSQHEAKDRELRQLREDNSRLHQQRHDDSERHRREVADLARMQASSEVSRASAMDMTSMRNIVQQIQASQLSRSDLESVIEDRVTKQLSGVAKKHDIEAAGSSMQRALQQLPSGASTHQMQQVVSEELDRAVEKLANKVKPEQKTIHNNTTMIYNQAMMNHAMIEKGKKKKKKSKRLELEMGPDPMLLDESFDMHEHQLMHSSTEPIMNLASASGFRRKSHSDAIMAHESFDPDTSLRPSESASNVVVRPKDRRRASSPGPLVELVDDDGQDDLSDTQSHQSRWDRRFGSKPMLAAIEEAPSVMGKGKGKMRAIEGSVEDQAMFMPKMKEVDYTPGGSSVLTKIARPKLQELEHSSSERSMVKKKHRGSSHGGSSVMKMPDQALGAMSMAQNMRDELPEDFPDNASQITSWERSQASGSAKKIESGRKGHSLLKFGKRDKK